MNAQAILHLMLPAAPPAEAHSDSVLSIQLQLCTIQCNVHPNCGNAIQCPSSCSQGQAQVTSCSPCWQHDAGIYNHLWSPLLLLITRVSTIGYLSEGSFMVKQRFPLDLVYFQNRNSISQNTKSSQRGFYFDTQSSPKYLPTL